MIEDDWHPRALRKLETLNTEGLDQGSLAWSKELLLELRGHGIKPDRIIRTEEDVIAMWFRGTGTNYRIECADDGYVLSILAEKSRHIEFGGASGVIGALIAEEAKELKTWDE